jgi:hypothetical protein
MTEFDDIGRRLREQRPELSALELDEVKQRARRRAYGTPRKGQTMRSRLAILLMLVAGMLLSTTGAGLAIQGFSESGSASQAQYGAGERDDDGDVAGEETGGDPGTVEGDDSGDLQPAQQAEVTSGGDELPFTGFAAIPVLIGGVALLGGGLLLRRRAADDS